MTTRKILIIDEYGFARVCSAILMNSGYETDVITAPDDLPAKLCSDAIGLIITSYPFSAAFLESLKKKNLPVMILIDNIDERLMGMLNHLQHSCCMIKPIDYDRFKRMVKQVFEGALPVKGGYSIV